MTPLDAAALLTIDSPLSLAAFILGMTQLLKEAGVMGNWLKLAAFGCGVFAKVMIEQFPLLWADLSEILIALTVTGLVSFGNDMLQKMRRAPNE